MGKKLTKVRIENVLAIEFLEFAPEGPVFIIGGKNRQGKTSVLKALKMLLAGDSPKHADLIHDDAEEGVITGEIDGGEMVATLKLRKDKAPYLTVKGKEGKNLSSPRDVMKKLFGPISIDPVKFLDMSTEKQTQMVKDIVQCDVSDLDAQIDAKFDARTDVSREVKALEVELETMQVYDGVPADEVSVIELAKSLEKIQAGNRENQKQRDNVDEMKRQSQECIDAYAQQENVVNELKEKLKAAEKKLAAFAADITEANKNQEIAESQANNLKDIDETEVRAQMESAEETNKKVRANHDRMKKAALFEGKQAKQLMLSDEIDQLRAERQKRLNEAKWPIAGLSLDEHGVTYQGKRLGETTSDSEEIRISAAMGMAAARDLDLMFIDRIEALDDESQEALFEMAEASGMHVIATKMSTGSECHLVISDGKESDRNG